MKLKLISVYKNKFTNFKTNYYDKRFNKSRCL